LPSKLPADPSDGNTFANGGNVVSMMVAAMPQQVGHMTAEWRQTHIHCMQLIRMSILTRIISLLSLCDQQLMCLLEAVLHVELKCLSMQIALVAS
jgi:hypothetical protein